VKKITHLYVKYFILFWGRVGITNELDRENFSFKYSIGMILCLLREYKILWLTYGLSDECMDISEVVLTQMCELVNWGGNLAMDAS